MWAAATSGISALGVYLLACLLARAWDAKHAVSIWIEIVEQRRKEIVRGIANHDLVSESSRMVLSQDVSRKDLAGWDASVRAWLQSADCARFRQHTQLMLIVKNVQLLAPGGSTTYSQIVDSWRHAMTGLECLLKGEPQEISNRAVLLAYSSWHIYPDLVVLSKEVTKVVFNDDCVNSRGVGTLINQPPSMTANRGMTWSLALSHLRYYGDPVIAKSDLDTSRVTIQQLHLIALGSIFNHWNVSRRDIGAVSEWFTCLWDHLQKSFADNGTSRMPVNLAPMRCLTQAARKIFSSDALVKEEALQLLNFGRRRAERFLSASKDSLIPFFGLGNACLLAGLSERNEEKRGLAYLRELSKQHGLGSSDAFIKHRYTVRAQSKTIQLQEFLTAIPHTCALRKRDAEGRRLKNESHGRWLYVKRNDKITTDEYNFLDALLQTKLKHIQDRGEHARMIPEPPFEALGDWIWPRPPPLYDAEKQARYVSSNHTDTKEYKCPSFANAGSPCHCFDYPADTCARISKPIIYWSLTNIGDFELLVRRDPEYMKPYAQASTQAIPDLHPSASMEICTSRISPFVLAHYLQCSLSPCLRDQDLGFDRVRLDDTRQSESLRRTDYIKELAKVKTFSSSRKRLLALRALALANEIYSKLDGAMISTKIVESPLDEALWLESQVCDSLTIGEPCQLKLSLPRTNALSCIVQFESGNLGFEPEVFEETLAITSGNSIFVISRLLSDPSIAAAEHGVRRITGNIGRPGISFLVAPVDPKIRALGDQYDLVTHAPYDGKRENNFESTSLHLSFTNWAIPIEAKGARSGLIDQDAYFVESIVSVFDAGKWVADLDVLRTDFYKLTSLECKDQCLGHPDGDLEFDCTSIDSWEELLDKPREVGFFRAYGNWAARLAAVSIICQQGQSQSIGLLGPGDACLRCLVVNHVDGGLAKSKLSLPSIYID